MLRRLKIWQPHVISSFSFSSATFLPSEAPYIVCIIIRAPTTSVVALFTAMQNILAFGILKTLHTKPALFSVVIVCPVRKHLLRFYLRLIDFCNQSGKLLRREGPAAQAKGLFRAHKALEPGGGPLRVGDEPVPGRPAHQDGAVLVHADRAGGQELPGGVGDKLAAPVPPHGGQGVGGAQVDADDCHVLSPLSLFAEPIIAPGKGVCKGERRRRGPEKNGGPGIYGRGVLKKRRVLI